MTRIVTQLVSGERREREHPSASGLCRGAWSDAQVARLKDLRRRGFSASEIGRELGTSRDAVLGKLWRLRRKSKLNRRTARAV